MLEKHVPASPLLKTVCIGIVIMETPSGRHRGWWEEDFSLSRMLYMDMLFFTIMCKACRWDEMKVMLDCVAWQQNQKVQISWGSSPIPAKSGSTLSICWYRFSRWPALMNRLSSGQSVKMVTEQLLNLGRGKSRCKPAARQLAYRHAWIYLFLSV